MRERKVEKIINGQVIHEYVSLTEASNTEQISLATLHRACKKEIAWRYKVDQIPNELWKRHPTLNIECSDHGRIKLPSGKITKGSVGKSGYLYVYPFNKTHLVARLIAQTWIVNEFDKPTVDHIDRDRQNNNVSNLRWATMYEQGQNKNTYTTDRKPYPKNRKSRLTNNSHP